MKIKPVFEWLAQRPARNYTLGEFFQIAVKGKDPATVNDNIPNFTRLGRGVERAHMAAGVATALCLAPGLLLAGAPLSMVAIAVAAPLAGYKAMGLAAGKVADMVMRP